MHNEFIRVCSSIGFVVYKMKVSRIADDSLIETKKRLTFLDQFSVQKEALISYQQVTDCAFWVTSLKQQNWFLSELFSTEKKWPMTKVRQDVSLLSQRDRKNFWDTDGKPRIRLQMNTLLKI